ncbi:MAG: TAXI family TRAP transporter solute-binding subunit [Desulfobacterales bacterium]
MSKKTMKLRLTILSLLLGSALVLAGGALETSNAQMTYLSLGTGGTAGTWYPVGGVLAAAMSKSGTVSVTAQASAASIENIRTVGAGERQLGMASSGLILFAVQGVEMFKGEKYPDLASIASMLPNQFQFVVRDGSGINSMMDLAGKTVGTGAPGSGDQVLAEGVLKALGLMDKVKTMPLSFAEQVTAFKNRQIDCIFVAAAAPTAAILDAGSQAKIKFLGFTPEMRTKILAAMPYAVDDVITTKQYNFLSEDIPTFSTLTTLFTSTKVPEQVVYNLTKAMWADLATIKASHSAMANWNMEMAVKGFPVPAHPGALKFYKEQGKM